MVRRDQAAEKARKRARQVEDVEYELEGEDIRLLSGQYKGILASQLFKTGPQERDYVVKHLWFVHDDQAMSIIRGFLCK